MIIHYISPSSLPSRSANSIHVVQQCNELANLGLDVVLYAKTDTNSVNLKKDISSYYGVELSANLQVIALLSVSTLAVNLRIALFAIGSIKLRKGSVIISRNLYAAFYYAVIRNLPILYETHQIETGARKWLQKKTITSHNVRTIVISKKLEKILESHHGENFQNIRVLHDAAPKGSLPIPVDAKREIISKIAMTDLDDWDSVCGYFGHLYKGRGIEIIVDAAKLCPRTFFLVFGGNEVEVALYRDSVVGKNILFMGHVQHSVAQQAMKSCDILLMPYQKRVAISGQTKHDTAKWMSPIKMFEYLASGVPLISSNLAVLTEILTDGVNALLVTPDNSQQWADAIMRLQSDPILARDIAVKAHGDYVAHYTWEKRAIALVDEAKKLT